MNKKMTRWFPANVLPVRNGAYRVDAWCFSWFQNGLFHGCWGSPDDALDAFRRHGKKHAKKRMPGWSVVTKWRGLAEAQK